MHCLWYGWYSAFTIVHVRTAVFLLKAKMCQIYRNEVSEHGTDDQSADSCAYSLGTERHSKAIFGKQFTETLLNDSKNLDCNGSLKLNVRAPSHWFPITMITYRGCLLKWVSWLLRACCNPLALQLLFNNFSIAWDWLLVIAGCSWLCVLCEPTHLPCFTIHQQDEPASSSLSNIVNHF